MTTPIQSNPQWTHVAPSRQPTQVHELTDRLFSTYTIDGGGVQLAGCLLEDRLIVRLAFRSFEESPGASGRAPTEGWSVEIYVADDGKVVDEQTVKALGLKETVPLEKPPKFDQAELERLVARLRLIAEDHLGDVRESQRPDVASTTLVWCKFAEGKLRFSIGESSAEIPFAGWAETFSAPPFTCPYTGACSFHVAATDDGRVTVAEEIRFCDSSGRRVLRSELVRCTITGKTILSELAETCPVSGVKLLRSALTVCPMCSQGVSPASVVHGCCAGCRSLKSISKDDPTMARVFGEYPGLDCWRHWQIAETATVYILLASGLFKRLLVVLTKESLDLLQLATGIRFLSGWTPVDPALYDEVLR